MSGAKAAAVTGRIFEIQRFSIHDGPGIRTTVFVKGCALHCQWCHNPEGISPDPELSFFAGKCIGCGYCFSVCSRGAHKTIEDAHVVDRAACRACGHCARECYGKALELVGREISAAEALEQVVRDRPFYETSGGGMTLSGGEPIGQIAFAESLLREAKGAGLHCCVETSGHGAYERLDRILPYVDLWLYDYKDTDPRRHRQYTGVSNRRILANLRALHEAGAHVLLRCPIVPGCNDRDDHFDGIAALAAELPNLRGVEVMPYHRLGESKTERFGMDSRRIRSQPPQPQTVNSWIAALATRGVQDINTPNTQPAK